ncbi:hypothetical protein ACFQ0K_10510 [Nocardioides caeni]|uniref:Uncharacterized protein n=1 Tax=Nocardioides caeni TaxID=574700 RepID=A0A4V4HJ70_9ACTN|nr:hypothetical protein [Nocardioides caeni]THV09336.1 hypothetical protein E9934_16480 [Nocardioides caeni]
MSDTPQSQPRSILAVLGVLVLVAAVVAGAILLAQRASDRTAGPDNGETSSPSDQASINDAPTPSTGASGDASDELADLPTIDSSDFPTVTEEAGLPTGFPTDNFPAQFPTDSAGWDEWAEDQLEQMRP